MVNLNVRVLGNGHIFASYQKDGRAYDAGFADWSAFLRWLSAEVGARIDWSDARTQFASPTEDEII